jgi:hypothetical protein
LVADGGDAAGDGDGGEGGAVVEGGVADRGDGVAAEFVGDGQMTRVGCVEIGDGGFVVGDGVGVVAFCVGAH